MPLPLFNLGSALASATLLSKLRNTSYISEVTSGEGSPEDSGLWNLLSVVPPSLTPSKDEKAYKDPSALLSFAEERLKGGASSSEEQGGQWEILALVVADEKTDSEGSFLIVELNGKGGVKETLRVAANSVLEVASNLHVANMSLSEFRNMSGDAPVYDAGYSELTR